MTAKQTRRVTVRLSDALVDLDRAVTVRFNGKVKFKGTVDRQKSRMSESLSERADNRSAASATITVGNDSSVWLNGSLAGERFLGVGSYRVVLFGDDSTKELASTEFEVRLPRPNLRGVRNADGTLTLSFEGKLEHAPTVNGPWRKSNISSPLRITPTSRSKFFRATH